MIINYIDINVKCDLSNHNQNTWRHSRHQTVKDPAFSISNLIFYKNILFYIIHILLHLIAISECSLNSDSTLI